MPKTEKKEGALTFSFPDGWVVLKFDECNFHTKRWNSFARGSKAVDFIACYNDGVVWLIEVKDYRTGPRTKTIDLFDEVATKVRDSLAGLKVLALRESDSLDRDTAKLLLKGCVCFRVVLHIEQPKQHSKLFPQTIDWKSAKDQIRRTMRTIDPHCLVGDRVMLNGQVGWSVT